MLINSQLDKIVSASKQRRLWYKNSATPVVVAGFWYSYWNATGDVAAPGFTTGSTTDLIVTTNAAGTHLFSNPPVSPTSPAQYAGVTLSQFLSNVSILATQTGLLRIYDRVAHTGPLTPASGAYAGPWVGGNSTTRPSDGNNCELWAEIATGTSALTHTVTVSYKDSADVTCSATCAFAVSQPISRMLPFTLDSTSVAGGIKRIISISGSASPPTGTFNLVILRQIATFPIGSTGDSGPFNVYDIGCPRLTDGACITMMWYSLGTTAPSIFVDAAISQVQLGIE